ncbi:hypothetical protein NLI96_g4325 [Meripilus lineatus]|uniref:Uncharacterized protein n=1 Tax=Meripilus lineatus TaxID=2056292 RepID=A0AAD5V569_9APHY|nr:hypothetical protein NLI96_g4325 [Physisporinus lineatus]
MLFSSKLVFFVFATFSVATVAFTTPLDKTEPALATRRTDVLSTLQSLQSTISPMLDDLPHVAATGSDRDLVVALSSISLLKVAAVAQVDLFLSVFLNTLATINANIIVDVGKGIPLLDVNIFARLGLVLNATVIGLVDVLGIVNI